ncbi:MAG TPA: hypothetical protein VG265_14195 [Gaiellaceae bacterium]|jgi:hypothetical protein|nr:hypothetical protein [Gaiellaceae bacterium]
MLWTIVASFSFALAGYACCALRQPRSRKLQQVMSRRDIVLVPVAAEMAVRLGEWSDPVHVRLVPSENPMLWNLEAKHAPREVEPALASAYLEGKKRVRGSDVGGYDFGTV